MRRFILILLFQFIAVFSFSQYENQQEKLFSIFFNDALKYRLAGNYQKAIELYTQCLKLNEKSAPVFYELSRITQFSDDLKNANIFINYALKYDSTNIHYIKYSINLKLNLNLYNEALALCDKLISIDKNNIEYVIISSRIASDCKNYKRALSYLDNVSAEDENVADLLATVRANIYLLQKDYKKSLSIVNKLYKKDPNNFHYSNMLFDIYMQQGKSEKAIQYATISSHLPDGEPLLFDIAEYYYSKSDTSNFYSYADSAFNNYNIPPELKYSKLRYYYSKHYFSNNKYLINYLSNCVNLHPEFEPFYLWLSEAYCTFYQDTDNALKICTDYFNIGVGSSDFWKFYLRLLDFSNTDKQQFYSAASKAFMLFPDDPDILLIYSQSLQMQNEYYDSLIPLKHCLEIVNSVPNSNNNFKISILHSLANAYFYIDSLELCYSTFDNILQIDPYNTLALNNYSYFLAINNQNLDKAESMSHKVIDLESTNPIYLDTYAWVLYKLNRYNEALFIIERAIENLNNKPESEIFDHYGDILLKLEMYDKALINWKKALEYSPNNESIKSKIEQYSNL